MHLDRYHELALHLKKIAKECQSSGREYCLVDAKVLATASAAIDELLLKVMDARHYPSNKIDDHN